MNLAVIVLKGTLTHKETALYLGISEDTLLRWTAGHGLP